jgi:DNA-binding transcriptional regulator YdaS (Cro superfamily)
MKNRLHPLRLWLATNGKTLTEFAEEIGANTGYLSQCITGSRRPTLDFCDRIKRATKGAVTSEDF